MITANTTHTIMPIRTTATTTPTIMGTGLELEELELELEEGKTSNFIATSEKSTLHRTDSLSHSHTSTHTHTDALAIYTHAQGYLPIADDMLLVPKNGYYIH